MTPTSGKRAIPLFVFLIFFCIASVNAVSDDVLIAGEVVGPYKILYDDSLERIYVVFDALTPDDIEITYSDDWGATWSAHETIFANAHPSYIETLGADIDASGIIHISFSNTNDNLEYCYGSVGSWNCEAVDVTTATGRYNELDESGGVIYIVYIWNGNYPKMAIGTTGAFVNETITTTVGNGVRILNPNTIVYGSGASANTLSLCTKDGVWTCDTTAGVVLHAGGAREIPRLSPTYVFGGTSTNFYMHYKGTYAWSSDVIINKDIDDFGYDYYNGNYWLAYRNPTSSELELCSGVFGSWSCNTTYQENIDSGDVKIEHIVDGTLLKRFVFYIDSNLYVDRFWEGANCDYTPTVSVSGNTTVNTNTDEIYTLSTNMNTDYIIWGVTDGFNQYNPKNIRSFAKIDLNWYAWNDATDAYDISVTENYVYNPLVNFALTSEQYSPHQVYVRVQDTTCGFVVIDTLDITVSGTDYSHTIPIRVYDTSSPNAFLNSFNLTVKDYTANTTTTYTGISSNTMIPVELYHQIAVTVTKNGYLPCDNGYPNNECARYYIYPTNPSSFDVFLNPACGASAGQMCEHIMVLWDGSTPATGIPVTGMQVKINNQTLITNAGGLVNINLLANTTYYVEVLENTVFSGANGYITTNAEGYNHFDYFEVIPKSLITPTPTLPTVTTTVPPTTTSAGAGGVPSIWSRYFGVDLWVIMLILTLIVSMGCAAFLGYVVSKGGGTGGGVAASMGFVGAFVICTALGWADVVFCVVIIIAGIAVIVLGRGGGGG